MFGGSLRLPAVLLVCATALTTQAQSLPRSATSSLPNAPTPHRIAGDRSAAPELLLAAADPALASGNPALPAAGESGYSSSSWLALAQAQSNAAQAQSNSTPAQRDDSGKATVPADEQQPKRILGLMPNYRAVSAGVRPPPPGAKESFIIATENNFDYSQYVFVGLTSLMAEGSNTHPEFGKGVGGYWSYYWRGYIDKSAGDYLIIFAFPTLFHEDERYFAMGQGSFWKRVEYSSMSVFITPNYHGKNTVNLAEILGRGVSQAVSLTYYPSAVATPSSYFSKFGYAVGRDALTNVFREFYPDIAHHVFHHHKKSAQKDS